MESLRLVARDLPTFKYTDTFVYFVNLAEEGQTGHLAIRDAEQRKICAVKEVCMDYAVLSRRTFCLATDLSIHLAD